MRGSTPCGFGSISSTSDHFPHDNWFNRSLSGNPGQSFTVTVKVKELATAGVLPFNAYRLGPQAKDPYPEAVTMHNGEPTITINPFELVTLRSNGPKP